MDEIIDFSEIGQFIDDPFRTYSAGMKLRLGFAVSVHTEPEILLIDEVLSVGDLAFQQKCVNRIRQLKQSGCSIIVISHDLEQIGDLCDRALWLQGGRCRAYGEPQELVERYQAAMHAETRQRAPSGAPVAYTAEGVALQHDVNRFGSLEATIEAVRVLDAAGHRTATLRTGEAATIEIDIRANSPVVGPHLSVAFGRDDETDCLDMNSGMDDVVFDEISGLQTASIRFSRLDLGKGKYRLSVGVHHRDWQYSFDYHWRAYSFDVVSDTAAPGVLVPPREWRIA
jgi:lipopolysaccharide transport system ATP-binding protein